MLELFAVKFECYGDGEMFSKEECVFTVDVVDDCMCSVTLKEAMSASDWPEVSEAIQAALDFASKPLALCGKEDGSPQNKNESTITLGWVNHWSSKTGSLRLKARKFYDLPVTRGDDGGLWCDYEPWSLQAFADSYEELVEEVRIQLAYLWRTFALEDDENIQTPALAVKRRLLEDWSQIA